MDVFDRRRAKLKEMLTTISQAELSRKSGVAASYISRCLKEPDVFGYKTIGEVTARKLESGAQKFEGWMDATDEFDFSPADLEWMKKYGDEDFDQMHAQVGAFLRPKLGRVKLF